MFVPRLLVLILLGAGWVAFRRERIRCAAVPAEQAHPVGQAHPASALNDIVHHRARLGIPTVLAESRQATFPYLKSLPELTDGSLGRHFEVLADEGLDTITKGYENKRPRSWASLTDDGYLALTAEMAVLKEFLSQFENGTARPR